MCQKRCFGLLFLMTIPLLMNIGFSREQNGKIHNVLNLQTDTTSAALSNIFVQSREISKNFSEIMGVSMSPLLGMGALGAYRYYKTPEAERANLPWYNSPKFWIPLFIILLLIILKDFLTTAIPLLQPLKMPLDAAENFENIISALIAMPIVLTLLAHINDEFLAIMSPVTHSQIIHAGIVPYLETILLIVVGATAFMLVWLASHSINVLILLSPLGIIDLALRALRIFMITILIVSTAIHPFLGLIFCLILFFIGYRISGWSFRLMVFGLVFSADLLNQRYKKFEVDPAEIRVFSGKAIPNVPSFTYGILRTSGEAAMAFVYKPWLVKPARSIELPGSFSTLSVGRGVINPVLLQSADDRKSDAVLFRFPPRYQSHEENLANVLRITSIRDVGVKKGIRAIRQWINENIKDQKINLALNR